jgi:bacterioferritin
MPREKLIEGLNEDLAAELGAVIRYTYQAARAFGFSGARARDIFRVEALDELGHAAYLADAIVDFGGEPTTQPKSFEKVVGLKAMLEVDVRMELEDVKNYMAHAELVEELGEVELKLKLEEMAADEAGHARQLKRLINE